MNQLIEILLLAPPILLALTFHEYAHAYVANRLGDPTAKSLGRLSLNPLVHLDLLGTAMLFLVHIGWAKPVPVNPFYFKNPKRDLLWVSLAGPGANMLLAVLFGLAIRGLGDDALAGTSSSFLNAFKIMLIFGLVINIALAVFNILPIPPLDGSKILIGLMPQRYEHHLEPFLKYGPTILIAIILIGFVGKFHILGLIINPFVRFFSSLLAGVDLDL
ncbi:MAG: site-2 protease family protein [candidate division KSB1 bacterium]|nr:site-2 protease family protein [candidate division KSB1 bacterium]MDZ7318199.1 site-2 protease family protein [candidate division KSB1 bacterium]MDZ7341600.1 site-2 protease family protein [candidate division KSB1 bacterium]